MHSRVMTHGRFCPMRWQRSADCHSAAGFHHLFSRLGVRIACRTREGDKWRLRKGEGLRVNDEDSGSLRQVEGDTARLERDEEDLDVGVVHEVLD